MAARAVRPVKITSSTNTAVQPVTLGKPSFAGRPRVPLATAYVPYQKFGETYPPKEALPKGTLFPCLYRPYK